MCYFPDASLALRRAASASLDSQTYCPLIDVVGRSLQNLVEIEGWIVGQFTDGRNFQRHFTPRRIKIFYDRAE
jgi:hypothetical protein